MDDPLARSLYGSYLDLKVDIYVLLLVLEYLITVKYIL